MRFEKLTENKIKITLNNKDLAEKNIDFHSFMSNSLETQTLFLDMLDEAEEKVGFSTKNYKIRVEALAMSDGNFIVTVTRLRPDLDIETTTNKSKRLKAKRKEIKTQSNQMVYAFNNFDDFCNFSSFINNIYELSSLAKKNILYLYKDKYFLVLSQINVNNSDIKKLYTIISEFATYVHNPDILAAKLVECGKPIFTKNALQTCSKLF